MNKARARIVNQMRSKGIEIENTGYFPEIVSNTRRRRNFLTNFSKEMKTKLIQKFEQNTNKAIVNLFSLDMLTRVHENKQFDDFEVESEENTKGKL